MKPVTIFLDIDGTILEFPDEFYKVLVPGYMCPVLPGSAQKCMEWHTKGYKIILTTGRLESLRKITEDNLRHHGIIYDALVMGLGAGKRVVINDVDPLEPSQIKAEAINIKRNEGISNIEL